MTRHRHEPGLCYELFKAGKEWVDIAKNYGISSPDRALEMARNHASAARKPWPPEGRPGMSQQERARKAYEDRRSGASWQKIQADLGGLEKTTTRRLARDHARANGLPWPILKDRRTLQARRKEAYELAVEGFDWADIAAHISVIRKTTARGYARDHAQSNGLPWPIDDVKTADVEPQPQPQPETADAQPTESGPDEMMMNRNRRCYEARQDGTYWAKIAEAEGMGSAGAACSAAKTHAGIHGLPWPIVVPSDPKPPTGQVLYEARLKSRHTAWYRIASEKQMDVSQAVKTAGEWAVSHGKSWPIVFGPDGEVVEHLGRDAYNERVKTGNKWRVIAKQLGANGSKQASTAAKSYASAYGMEWPAPVPATPDKPPARAPEALSPRPIVVPAAPAPEPTPAPTPEPTTAGAPDASPLHSRVGALASQLLVLASCLSEEAAERAQAKPPEPPPIPKWATLIDTPENRRMVQAVTFAVSAGKVTPAELFGLCHAAFSQDS